MKSIIALLETPVTSLVSHYEKTTRYKILLYSTGKGQCNQWVETMIGFSGITFIADKYGFHILEGADDCL